MRSPAALWLGLALLAAWAAPAAAQNVRRLDVQVVQIAGADVYLDRGTDAGLATGDTAEAERAGVVVGALRVTSATATRAVATTVGAPFALTRGDRLVLLLASAAAPPPVAEAETPPAVPGRASILAPPDGPAASPRAVTRLRVTGRVQTGLSGFQSTTTPTGGAAAVGRTDALPFASLRADVTGLPGGARLRLNGRTARSGAGVDVSLYEAAVEGGRGAVHVQAGRFANGVERVSGFWDGLDIRVGGAGAGVGATGGLQPERTTGLPGGGPSKLAAYAYVRRGPAARRVAASATVGRVGGAPFAGADASVSGRAGATPVGLTADLLADASGSATGDSSGGAWSLARASVRLTAAPGPARFRLAYRRLRPSALTLAGLPAGVVFVPVVAENVSAGASVDVGRGSRRPTLFADASLYRRGGVMDGRSVGGGLAVLRLPGVPVGLGADATLFTRDARRTLSASATLRADIGLTSVSLGVRTSRTTAPTFTTALRTVEAGLSVPIGRRLGLVAQASAGGGGGFRQSTLYTSLWVRL